MPLYEYQCKKCETKFETLVSLRNAVSPAKCPRCGSEETSRLMSTFAACKGTSSDAPCRSSGT